ncbi:hypothetical protein [Streptomyces avicenniae]|uniref:hypothetical protein n=1 Tax=Streptomyces avicenniae TaxID=500153 RepID=UPI00069BE38F|nr:hypothetical protein [Streptomyces avicenniae]
MSQIHYDHCFRNGEPCRHGPPGTIVYVCERDARTAARHARTCAEYARTRAWDVVDTIVESTPDLPLKEREGWRSAGRHLRDGTAEAVVIWHPLQVADDRAGFAVLQRDFRERYAVLVAATGIPAPKRAD